jgi:hypothetical protein
MGEPMHTNESEVAEVLTARVRRQFGIQRPFAGYLLSA